MFTLIARLGVGAPVVIYFAMGDRGREVLEELKTWMARNNTAIMAVLLPDHRRQADRRRDHRLLELRAEESHRTPPAAALPRSLTRSR